MRQVFSILVALIASAVQAGAHRLGDKQIDARQSAGFFAGIRGFDSDKVTQVPYAIDDAVDLAFELSIGQPQPLVPPERVVLALSPGLPIKKSSQEKLRALRSAGAQRVTATQSQILQQLEAQSRRVGRDGILVAGFATHGVSKDGVQYLAATGSDIDHVPTMIADNAISEIVSRNDVPRALIFIDACREQLARDNRGGKPDPRSVAAFIRIMTGVDGQAVISAAARGGYAYDDDAIQNGVFTAAVIDGLRCGARKDSHGFVTVDGLYDYVHRRVLQWIRQNKGKRAARATQLSCEGGVKKMPLSICNVSRTASAAPLHSE